MRRLIAIVLLALLPLQFSWAAVETYCGHEATADAAHFGHHQCPNHVAAADDSDASAKAKSPAAGDLDCSHCHGHCTGMPVLAGYPHGSLPGDHPVVDADVAAAVNSALRPERPQWPRLA